MARRRTRPNRPTQPAQPSSSAGDPHPITGFTPIDGDIPGNAAKRRLRDTLYAMVMEGLRQGLGEREIVDGIATHWPALTRRAIHHIMGAARRNLVWWVYGRPHKELRARALAVLDGIIASDAKPADRLAALHEWSRLLGLHEPVRVQQEITSTHTHVHYVREVARHDDQVRELMIQLGRRLSSGVAVEDRSCQN